MVNPGSSVSNNSQFLLNNTLLTPADGTGRGKFSTDVTIGGSTYTVTIGYNTENLESQLGRIGQSDLETALTKIVEDLALQNLIPELAGKTIVSDLDLTKEKTLVSSGPDNEFKKLSEVGEELKETVDKVINVFNRNFGAVDQPRSDFTMTIETVENSDVVQKAGIDNLGLDFQVEEIETDQLLLDEVQSKIRDIRETSDQIRQLHVEHETAVLGLFHRVNAELDKLSQDTNTDQLNSIEKQINTESNRIRTVTEEENKRLNDDLENQLQELVQLRNEARGATSRETIDREINILRQEQKSLLLSTHPQNIAHGKLVLFQGIVEKKLSLMIDSCWSSDKESRSIEKEFAKAPSLDEMNEHFERILEGLHDNRGNLTVDEAKTDYIQDAKELKWCGDYINIALTRPHNWLTKRDIGVRFNASGAAYVQATIVEPINIGEEGGVPAGLRDHRDFPGYRERPANLNMTTTYILDSKGEKVGNYKSFRIAQFPTKEAAKKAISTIMKECPDLEDFHDNTLLTPTMFPGRPDRRLVREHKQNISDALSELISEKLENSKDRKQLEKIKDNFTMTNFGVNEGAVGKMMGLKLGWHTSMKEFNNEASVKLANSINRKFEKLEKKLENNEALSDKEQSLMDRLGGIVQVGQELEAVWAKNDYAEADVGNNQVKAPALWRTLDSLLDITSNTHCMSAKDRASIVESNAIEYLTEIEMNLDEHKTNLKNAVDEWQRENQGIGIRDDEKQLLIQGSFTEDDVKGILNSLRDDQNELSTLINEKQLEKLQKARSALRLSNENTENKAEQQEIINNKSDLIDKFQSLSPGITITEDEKQQLRHGSLTVNDVEIILSSWLGGSELSKLIQEKLENAPTTHIEDGFLERKKGVKKLLGNTPQTWSISTNTPLREINERKEAAEAFPQLSLPSMYHAQNINIMNQSDDTKKELENRHRIQQNRRDGLMMADLVTRENTGVPGDKLVGGTSLKRFYSGFDPDFVAYSFLHTGTEEETKFKDLANDLLGLSQLSSKQREEIQEKAYKVFSNKATSTKWKEKQYREVLEEVMEYKYQSHRPLKKVKA